MNTSPALSDDASSAHSDTLHERAPFTCHSVVSYTPRTTVLKPLATPPFLYTIFLNSCENSFDSCPSTSRCCTGAPPR